MAGQAEKRGLPPELPLMASLVESGMKNLNFGDADSVGFFQMRVGIWNQGAYAGYPEKPELQVKWFLDTAESVKKARLAAGKPIDDPNSYGEWIADVERPAAQYRDRYQTKLAEAQDLLRSRPAARPRPSPPRRAVRPRWWIRGRSLRLAAAEPARRRGAAHRAEPGGRARGRDEHRPAGRPVPRRGQGLAREPVVRLVHHLVAGAGRAQDAGRRLGRVATWVRNAEQGTNGLKFVTAEEARPGDIVAYDWGGQNDFGADGHIGFLDSTVKDGKFTALEGNNADKVNVVPRSVGGGAKVVFIRVDGDAPAGAPPRRAGSGRRRAGARPRASKPIDPAQFGGEGTGTGGPPERRGAGAAGEQEHRARRRSASPTSRPAGSTRASIGVLTKLSQEHKITVSCMCSDHSKFTAGGSVSNHFFGRGVDIARDRRRDRRPRQPARARSRQRAVRRWTRTSARTRSARRSRSTAPATSPTPPTRTTSTSASSRRSRPTGSHPPTSPRRRPPPPVATAAAVAGRAGRPPRPPTPEVRKGSQVFLKAVTATAAEADRKKGASDSQAFLQAVEPPKASAAAVDPAAAPAPAAAGRRPPRRSRAGARRRRRRRRRRGARRLPRRQRARASRSPPGWPARRRSAACRRSCR